MKKVLVALPEDLIKLVKKSAVDSDSTFKDVLADALRQYLARREGGKKA